MTTTELRLPPHSQEKEAALLGSMMSARDCMDWGTRWLRSEDFYREIHRTIFAALCRLNTAGLIPDSLLVRGELAAQGQLESCGGPSYLMVLLDNACTTVKEMEFVAKQVREMATRRQMILLAQDTMNQAYEGANGHFEETLAATKERWYALESGSAKPTLRPLKDVFYDAFDDLEKRKEEAGLPSGIHSIDDVIGGLFPGSLYVIAARPRQGKALALDTLIPTSSGFKKMGDLNVDDIVFDETGHQCAITYVSPVFVGHECYRVRFDDGASVICDAEHLWDVSTRKQRKNMNARVRCPDIAWVKKFPQCQPRTEESSVLSTSSMLGNLLRKDQPEGRGAKNYAVKMAGALRIAQHEALPIPPYTLGVWLGDGETASARVTCADNEILAAIQAEGVSVSDGKECNSGKALLYALGRKGKGSQDSLQSKLRRLGVLGNKHIPNLYLFASPENRLALLQGLMDTDGSIFMCGGYAPKMKCEFYASNPTLAHNFITLACSLGLKARLHEKKPPRNSTHGTSYRVSFSTSKPVFKLPRKLSLLPVKTVQNKHRRIVAIEEVESVPTKCIAVDSPSHLYLCTERFIPTHNTTLCLNWLSYLAIHQNMPAAFFSMEMRDISLAHKILAAEKGLDPWKLRIAKCDEDDWSKAIAAANSMYHCPLYIDDSSAVTLDVLSGRIRAAVREAKVKVIGVDYLQLLNVPGLEMRHAMVACTHGFKALCRDLNIPIILLSQISRQAEGRLGHVPELADLKESSSIEEDADVVLLISHPSGKPTENEGELIVAKNRLGPGGQHIRLSWQPRRQAFYGRY